MQCRKLLLLLLLFFCTGCGYRWGEGGGFAPGNTIFVPYIEGDIQGHFTNALIYEIVHRSSLRYESEAPDYILKVCFLPPIDTTIGFRYGTGNESRVVLADEGRLTLIASVTMIDCDTGIVVRRWDRIIASIDYDFESDFSHLGEDVFSLGQLKMHAQARESSSYGLAELMAQKIVDSLLYCW